MVVLALFTLVLVVPSTNESGNALSSTPDPADETHQASDHTPPTLAKDVALPAKQGTPKEPGLYRSPKFGRYIKVESATPIIMGEEDLQEFEGTKVGIHIYPKKGTMQANHTGDVIYFISHGVTDAEVHYEIDGKPQTLRLLVRPRLPKTKIEAKRATASKRLETCLEQYSSGEDLVTLAWTTDKKGKADVVVVENTRLDMDGTIDGQPALDCLIKEVSGWRFGKKFKAHSGRVTLRRGELVCREGEEC